MKQQYKNIKSFEITFFDDKYLKPWEKHQYYVSPFNMLFYDKTQLKCLKVSESHIAEYKLDGTSGSKDIDIKQLFKKKDEQDKIKYIFQDLINNFE